MGKAKPDVLQGTLDLLILKTLSHSRQHGYGIAVHIQHVSRNALRVEEGSLYPALHRIEQDGWIRSEWGVSDNGRKSEVLRNHRPRPPPACSRRAEMGALDRGRGYGSALRLIGALGGNGLTTRRPARKFPGRARAYRDRQGVLWFSSVGLQRFVPRPDGGGTPPPIRISRVMRQASPERMKIWAVVA